MDLWTSKTETIRLITDEKQFKYARYTPLLYLKDELSDFEKTGQKNMGGFMKILAIIKRNLPNQLFNATQTAKDISMSSPKEVILSEYLLK